MISASRSFCLALASRGAVYLSAESAAFNARGEKYHDHCACQPEPLFEATAAGTVPSGWTQDVYASPEALAAREKWEEVTAGKGGSDAINAFRRAAANATAT